jgi:steroid delta-isomerase-like uncharacterized protein
MLNSNHTGSPGSQAVESYDADSDLVDFILGITFEIWEQKQVEKILDYYAADVEVYSLEGRVTGAATMVDNTYATLAAYPDRLLIPDDVITTGTTRNGFSSHRLLSPMTNKGDTLFAPATGRNIWAMNIADCELHDGLITREWLMRDNLAITSQLGLEPRACARIIADRFDDRQRQWLQAEYQRATESEGISGTAEVDFAREVLAACWLSGDIGVLHSAYAPYCVLHRAPLRKVSGRERIMEHYTAWRAALPSAGLSIDHVCSQPFDENNQRIAVRWSVAGVHAGDFENAPASGKPLYIVGVTHWQIVEGRIAAEKTVFDELSVVAQTLD